MVQMIQFVLIRYGDENFVGKKKRKWLLTSIFSFSENVIKAESIKDPIYIYILKTIDCVVMRPMA